MKYPTKLTSKSIKKLISATAKFREKEQPSIEPHPGTIDYLNVIEHRKWKNI